MRWAFNPALGKMGRQAGAERIRVAESHEEHLVNAYPGLVAEVERLKALDVPASFMTIPGKVTGKELARLGVEGICRHCGHASYMPNPDCRKHPENAGGGQLLESPDPGSRVKELSPNDV